MSAEARRQRKLNSSLPTAEELREMQKLENEREARLGIRHTRRMQRAGNELQIASIVGNTLIQLPATVEANKAIVDKCRAYMDVYLDHAMQFIAEEPEAEDAADEETEGATPESEA